MGHGKDTHKTFTDHLYTSLVQAGCRTFKDDDDIEKGESIKLELHRAIPLSRISVIAFSKNFASSKWCLDELLTILECKRTSEHVVIPVFYDVDPTEVKNQTGSFVETFMRHEQMEAENDERKNEWMQKEHESKFIQKIVKVIEDKLNRKILSDAPFLIRMDSRVTSINLWLQDESTDVGVLVICGMGGIKKTIIAKFVYNLNYERFEEHADQLDAITGIRDCFHRGSKIIITIRLEGLLQAYKADEVQKVEKLDESESFELFSWHAFGQNHPIEVLGSSLSGRSIDVRESTLRKLELIPKSQIVKKLKISYDSLQDDHDKNLFLYIACFFVGKDKDFSVRILDECDFYTTVGIQNLIDRCLITIDKNNKMMMHQLLQDMGREIICQESPKSLGNGTETIKGLVLDMHMLREVTSSKSVLSANISNQHCFKEVFSLNQHHFGFLSCHPAATELKNANEAYFKTNALARMHKLRLLHLNYVQLSGSYRELPKGLRWLCWQGFRSKFIPEDFALESLVVLDMRYSSLERVWKRTKFLGLLKFLNLNHSHGLVKTPDFSQLPNLESLMESLKALHVDGTPLNQLLSTTGLPSVELLLVEIQGVFKLLPLGMVETEMIQILGLINLESLANIEVFFMNGWNMGKCPIQKNRQPILYVEISTENEALNQDMISHWSIGNQLKRGDEVNVSVTVRTLFKLKEYGVHVVYEKELKQATQDKFYPSCSQSNYIVNTGMYNLNNQVLPKDDALASISCSGWENYICQTFAETTDEEQKHPNSGMTGRARGHKAVLITRRMKCGSRD
ncbi:unnamed protein product [Camellia sinensis]